MVNTVSSRPNSVYQQVAPPGMIHTGQSNGLKAFLNDGRIEMDNNPAKNAIRLCWRGCPLPALTKSWHGGKEVITVADRCLFQSS
ncbi:hypothetical protein J11TS1_20470 [Oceanobacillus sp. J11TS1]|nr:hypothetical protein J11TS1_20470 [Oceanobacillus sp. J11TS1]